jgi:hypothetical protein
MSRQHDRLDVELNFERRMSALTAQSHGKPRRSGHKHDPDLVRVRGKIRHDEYFPGGGQQTTWITDGSSASDWEQEKENSPRYHPYTRPVSTWSPRQPPSAPCSFRSPIRSTFPSPKRSNFQSPNHLLIIHLLDRLSTHHINEPVVLLIHSPFLEHFKFSNIMHHNSPPPVTAPNREETSTNH